MRLDLFQTRFHLLAYWLNARQTLINILLTLNIELKYMKIGESKISQRGSTVIPKGIREALQVKDGEFIEWHIVPRSEGKVNITVVKKKVTP